MQNVNFQGRVSRKRFWWASFDWQTENLVQGNRTEWACTFRPISSDKAWGFSSKKLFAAIFAF